MTNRAEIEAGTRVGVEWLVCVDAGRDPVVELRRDLVALGPAGLTAVHVLWLQVIDACRGDRHGDVLVAGPPVTACGSAGVVEAIRIVDEYRRNGPAKAVARWLALTDLELVEAVSLELASMAARLARAHLAAPVTGHLLAVLLFQPTY